jgi:hypothetical protein
MAQKHFYLLLGTVPSSAARAVSLLQSPLAITVAQFRQQKPQHLIVESQNSH